MNLDFLSILGSQHDPQNPSKIEDLRAKLASVGPSWEHVASPWSYVGPSWSYVGQFWSYVGPSCSHLGAMLSELGKSIENRRKLSPLGVPPHGPERSPGRPNFGDNVSIGLKINRCNFNQLEAAFCQPSQDGSTFQSNLHHVLNAPSYYFLEPLGSIFAGLWASSWEPSWPKNRSYGLLLASWPK